jgi:hypothetical protein
MAFEAALEPDEHLVFQEFFQASSESEPFSFAISNRALFLPAKKILARSDPWFFERVPHSAIQRVEVRRLRSWPLLAVSALMVLAGGWATATTWLPFLSGNVEFGRAKYYGYPLGLLVAGLALPWAARGRFGLVVVREKRSFKWKPPLVLDAKTKQKIDSILTGIAKTCREAGLSVVDERTNTTAEPRVS